MRGLGPAALCSGTCALLACTALQEEFDPPLVANGASHPLDGAVRRPETGADGASVAEGAGGASVAEGAGGASAPEGAGGSASGLGPGAGGELAAPADASVGPGLAGAPAGLPQSPPQGPEAPSAPADAAAPPSCPGPGCVAAACSNGLDCGGADTRCPRCAPGAACQVDADCASRACQGGRCCGGRLGDCTRCAERLSLSIDCDAPAFGLDPDDVAECRSYLACLADHVEQCPTPGAPGCGGNAAEAVCSEANFGGEAGAGVVRARQVLSSAGCQLR